MMSIRLPTGYVYTYKNAESYEIVGNTYYLYSKYTASHKRKLIAIVNSLSGVIIEIECPDCVYKPDYIQK